MAKVKTFEEYQATKSEGTAHGTPGEAPESGKTVFEVNEDSCCSTDCQGKIHEMYESLMAEMKKVHEDDSEMTAGEYLKGCEKILSECDKALKTEAEKCGSSEEKLEEDE